MDQFRITFSRHLDRPYEWVSKRLSRCEWRGKARFSQISFLNTLDRFLFLKRVVLSPRERPDSEAGVQPAVTSLLSEAIIGEPNQDRLMDTQTRLKIVTITPAELLGPLNDVERKYSPPKLYVSGSMEIPLPRPRVAIIGSRKASPEGLETAGDLGRRFTKKGVVIVSGLAEGIDTAAHTAAIEAKGRTIAVLGTPLDRVYPKKNEELQKKIVAKHLAVSQFPVGYPIQRRNFVLRNRTMALIANASIIVQAGETSGSLHQGWEALRLGRPLFIWKSVIEDPALNWPKRMMRYGALELSDPKQVMSVLPSSKRISQIVVQT